MNIAPYFFASGSSSLSFSFSPDMELISALPGYLRRAASITSTWLESMAMGRLTATVTSSSAFSIISFSSMPLIPTLMSKSDAPHISCSSAKETTISRLPSRSCACNFFFPVGLMRSPTIIKGESRSKATVFLSLERYRSPRACFFTGSMSFV